MEESLILIINEIPELLSCFVPGFAFFYIVGAMTNVKCKRDIVTFIFSVAMSVITQFLFSFMHKLALSDILFSSGAKFFSYMLFNVFLAAVFALLYRSKHFSSLFAKVFIKSFYPTVWENCIDFKGGSRMYIETTSGEFVEGLFYMIEEKGNDSWLALENYKAPNNDLPSNVKEEFDTRLLLKVSDIKYIQVVS